MEKTRIKVVDGPNGKRIFLGSRFPGVYFTTREAELAQLLEEYKYHEIGDLLTISRRTAEYYTMNMKKKLRCLSKRELVFVLRESGLIDQLGEEVDITYLFEEKEPKDEPEDQGREERRGDMDIVVNIKDPDPILETIIRHQSRVRELETVGSDHDRDQD